MITPEQYQSLLPFRNTILDRYCSSDVGRALAPIYAEHGRRPNLHCRACVEEMIDYFHNVITEYEQRKTNG